MNRTIIFMTWALFFPIGSAKAAPNPNSPITVYGLGTLSCATWLSSPEAENAGNQWILGFFTGANVLSAFMGGKYATVGHTTDQPGIFAEVKKVCDAEPSQLLFAAAMNVYGNFYSQSR